MIDATLCFLLRDDRVNLGWKKRGLGVGKLNGYGGKRQPGETLVDCAVRELFEEALVAVAPECLQSVGVLTHEVKSCADLDQEVYLYVVRGWQGEPRESEEMKPEWFSRHALPYDRMWRVDRLWVPRVLSGENVSVRAVYSADGSLLDGSVKNL